MLFGLGLLALGTLLLRRPERTWVGFRVSRNSQDERRTRRVNLRAGGWIAALGALDVLSGPLGYLTGTPPLALAAIGLVMILLAIVSLVASALTA